MKNNVKNLLYRSLKCIFWRIKIKQKNRSILKQRRLLLIFSNKKFLYSNLQYFINKSAKCKIYLSDGTT